MNGYIPLTKARSRHNSKNMKIDGLPGASRRVPRTVLVTTVLFLLAVSAPARDFPDPYATIDPLFLLEEDGPGAVMDWEYNQQFFRGSKLDDFQLNLVGGAGIFQIRQRFALGMRYGAYLFTGPGGEEIGTPHLSWQMNSLQFQYGLHAAYALRPQVRLLAEYSRSSNHPFTGRTHTGYDLSKVAFDRLAVGVGVPGLSFGEGGRLTLSARVAHIDLWDAWEADSIDLPRTQWLFRPAAQLLYPLPLRPFHSEETELLVEVNPDIFTQHRGGGIDATFAGRAGIRLQDRNTSRAIDIYLDTYFSRDTEKAQDQEFPVSLLGIGFRIGNASVP